MLPHDRLNIGLADAPQLAALLWRLGRAPAGAFIAPTRHAGVATPPSPAVAAVEQPGEQGLPPHLARGSLAVQLELARGHGEEFLADERRPRHSDPLLRRAQAPAGIFGRSSQPPTVMPGLRRVHASIIVARARVEPIAEDLVDTGGRPAHQPLARRDRQGGQPLREGVGRELLLDEPGEELPDDGRLGLVDDAPGRLAVAGREIGVAVRAGPGEEGPLPGRVEFAPATAL